MTPTLKFGKPLDISQNRHASFFLNKGFSLSGIAHKNPHLPPAGILDVCFIEALCFRREAVLPPPLASLMLPTSRMRRTACMRRRPHDKT